MPPERRPRPVRQEDLDRGRAVREAYMLGRNESTVQVAALRREAALGAMQDRLQAVEGRMGAVEERSVAADADLDERVTQLEGRMGAAEHRADAFNVGLEETRAELQDLEVDLDGVASTAGTAAEANVAIAGQMERVSGMLVGMSQQLNPSGPANATAGPSRQRDEPAYNPNALGSRTSPVICKNWLQGIGGCPEPPERCRFAHPGTN